MRTQTILRTLASPLRKGIWLASVVGVALFGLGRGVAGERRKLRALSPFGEKLLIQVRPQMALAAELVIVACSVVLLAGCGHGDSSSPEHAHVSGGQELTIGVPTPLTLSVPNPVLPLAPVIVAANSVQVGSSANIAGIVVSMGSTGGVNVGASEITQNDIWSRGAAIIGPRVQVQGTLHAAVSIVDPTAVIKSRDTNPTFDPATTLSWNVTFPTGTGTAVHVVAGVNTAIAPGNYSTLTVDPGGTLTLSTGTYYVSTFTASSQSSVKLDQANGPVIVYVSTAATMNGTFASLTGSAPNLLIGYLGTNNLSVGGSSGAPFRGAIIAPSVQLALLHTTDAHQGFFAAHDILVDTAATVQYALPTALFVAGADAALAQLEHDTGVVWQRTLAPATPSEMTVFLRPAADPGVTLPPVTQPDVASATFLHNYAAIFGIEDPTTELLLDQAHIGPDSIGYAAYQQVVRGVPVLGGRLTFMFNPHGRIDNISGHTIVGIRGMSIAPSINEAVALAIGQAEMATHFPSGTLGAALPTTPGALFIALQPGGPAKLARGVTALFADQINPLVHYGRNYIVDALSGTVLASGNAAQDQYKGTGAPVTATGQGSIEQERKLPLTRQFTAFSAKPPNGPPFFMQQLNPSPTPPFSVGTPIYVLDGFNKVQYSYQPVESAQLNSWDTGMVGEGAAVDAYVYFNYILSWWAQRGRLSFDNNGTPVPIVVHYPKLNCNSEFLDNEFHIGDCERAGLETLPDSSAIDVMGHEFQHAVNASVFNGVLFSTLLDPDAAPLNESLGDVFGQFIESDFHASASLAYAPTPTLFGEALYALMPGAVNPWARNLVSPHEPEDGNPRYVQPDAMSDCLYKFNNSDTHANSGIPNRAWSIATLGGIDSTTGSGLDPADSLGMNVSEQLYLSLIQNPPSLGNMVAGGDFKMLGNALMAFARMKYGQPQVKAVACAWWSVGVFSVHDALLQDVDVTTECASGFTTPCTSGGGQGPTGCGARSALASCPGTPCDTASAGDSCSTDGTNIYTCDGQGSTIGGTFCVNGCLPNALGLAACAGATGPGAGGGSGPCFSLLPGDYCGGNGMGNPSILYSCNKDSIVRAVSCVNGCQFNAVPGGPPAPPPGCSGGGSGSCFSLPVGDYCGDDQVCGDPNVLYHCDLNQHATVANVCAMGCTIRSSGSQPGGADQCTGPFSKLAGMDTCKPGPQVPVSSGGGAVVAGGGAYGGLVMGSGVVCSPGAEGFVGIPDLPNGLYCGNNNTITFCRGGLDQGIRMCPAGCTRGSIQGKDTCNGLCAGVISGTACASDGVTLLQCDVSVQVGQKKCPAGDICGGVPATCGPPCVKDSDCSPDFICRNGACEPSPSVTFRFSPISFATTADTDCNNPPASQDKQVISGVDPSDALTLVCNPIVNPDGSISTTPQTTMEQVSCGDGHGAVVQVSCSGDGIVGDVVRQAVVQISISDQCGTNTLDPNNTQLIQVSLNPGDSLTQPMDSCDAFSSACMGCNFNSFSADLQITASP